METAIMRYLKEARQNLLQHNYGRAYAFYLLILKLSPTRQSDVSEDFAAAWREWSVKLCELGRAEDLFALYEEGCQVFMQNDMLHFHMGCALLNFGMKLEAIGMFRKALFANEGCWDATVKLEQATRGLIDGWHFAMLNDRVRNEKFQSAISKMVKKSDTVLDIGSGTGILSMIAVTCDAAKVYACEMLDVMQIIGKECISLNDMQTKVCSFHCTSNNLDVKGQRPETDSIVKGYLDERVSLVISETVDAGLLGEGIIDTLNHAWQHLLLPSNEGGRVLPASATLYCVLVECEHIRKKHTVFHQHGFPGTIITSRVGEKEQPHQRTGTLFKGIRNGNMNDMRIDTCELEPYTSEILKGLQHKVLTQETKLLDIDFNNAELINTIACGNFENVFLNHNITQEGYVDAVVMWFNLNLEPSTTQASECELDETTINTCIESDYCWEQAVFPIRCCKKQSQMQSAQDTAANGLVITDRLCVNENDSIITEFKVHEDCLSLLTVKKVSHDESNKNKNDVLQQNLSKILHADVDALHITVHEEQVQRMNDVTFSNIFFLAISKQIQASGFHRVLDISNGFDLLAIKLAQVFNVEVHKYCQTPEVQSALCRLSQLCGSHIMLYGTIPCNSKLLFDVVVSAVIEPSGLISPNALRNIYEMQSSLSASGIIIPKAVTLVVQCISSEELLSKCLILNDRNTLGFKLSDIVNDFKVSIHSDLDINTLVYSTLCEPKDTLQFCFSQVPDNINKALSQQKSVILKITKSANLHAVLFWFKINVFEDAVIDTSGFNHWKQAAYVLPVAKQMKLCDGDEIVLKTTCENDIVSFNVSGYGRSNAYL